MTVILEIGAGYMIYTKSNDLTVTLLTFILMIVGLVCQYAAYQTDQKNKKSLLYLYQGYEPILLYASYILMMAVSLGIIFGLFDTFSVGSPFIMVMWLLPMVTMFVYLGAIVFSDKQLKISNKEINYKSIKQLAVEEIKNKKKITFFTKEGNYTYKAKAQLIDKITSFLVEKNSNIKIKS